MKPAEALRKYRKIINPPYQDKDWLVIFLTLFVLISIPLTIIAGLKATGLIGKAAGTATLSLSPSSQSINQGATFSVQVRENSGADPINAVQANLTYDATKLDFVSLDNPPSGTSFTVVAEGSGVAGSIRIARALAGGVPPVTGDQLVATVTFRAKYVPGATDVYIAAGSAVVRSTDNINILIVSSAPVGTYTVVNPPPTVTITSPANGATIKGTVNVTATASDDQGVTQVEFLVDGSSKSTDTTAPYEYPLVTTTLTDGSHNISAKAYDANTTTTATIPVTVDNNAPTVSISAPVGGALVRGTVNVTATASDTVGVTKVEFYVDAALKSTDTSSPFAYSWDTTGVSDGSHTLTAKAYDSANNVGTSSPITVTVDNTLPTASITSPTTGSYLRGTVTITVTASDTNGISKVEFRIDGTLKATDTTSPYSYSWDTTTTTDGGHTISTTAYDNPGNTSVVTQTVTVDNTAPTAPAGLAATAVSSTQINLSWTASTDTGGLAGYDVYRGGTKINAALVTTTSYNDTGLTPATSYSYYVKATDRAGNVSAASNTVSATTKKTADINGDGNVDIYDLSILLTRWGTNDVVADLNSNEIVDIFDLSILISSWGS